MNGEEEAPVEVGDDTPTLQEQAKAQGWQADLFHFGKANQAGVEHFNPGLVRRPDGLWLLVRRSESAPNLPYGMNKIWACRLEGDKERTPLGGPFLIFPNSDPAEQFEDPRAVYWNNQTWVGCVNFTWFPGDGSWWTGAHQCLGVFRDDSEWTPIARRDPIVGTNKGAAGHTHGQHNKNLLWWFLDGKLYCLYTSEPWLVVEFGEHWEDQIHHAGDGVKWKYGHVRGGTPPVQVGDLFYTFFHSSMSWRGRYRRYYMGALAFQAKPPFKPVLWTQEPLLIGSQNDPWHQGKPLVVFPCGAVLENEKWFVTFGVNDLKSAWIEIPYIDLLELLHPAPVMQASLLLAEATPAPVYERIQFDLGVPVLAEPVARTSGEGPVTEQKCLPSTDEAQESTESDLNASLRVADDSTGKDDLPSVTLAAPESIPIGGTGIHGIKCTCLEREFPCPFHFRDNETLLDKRRAQMAVARAVLAERRRLGLGKVHVDTVKRRRRKRRQKKVLNPAD